MIYRPKSNLSLFFICFAVLCVALVPPAALPVEPTKTGQQRPPAGVIPANWVAFSPDGKTLASASAEKTVDLWDVAKRQKIKSLKGHSLAVLCVAFSPDGKTLASSSKDNTVKLWDIASGKNTATLQGHFKPVEWIGFSPDGRTLASASPDGTIRLWEMATRKPRITFENYIGAVVPAAFSPDGKFVAYAGRDETIKLLDVWSGKEAGTFRGHRFMVSAVAFSPDGKSLASGERFVGKLGPRAKPFCTIILWDVATRASTKVLEREGNSGSLVFSPDGKTLASSSGATIKLWDLATSQNTFTQKAGSARVACLAFSPDGNMLVSAGSLLGVRTRETVEWWDIRGWR